MMKVNSIVVKQMSRSVIATFRRKMFAGSFSKWCLTTNVMMIKRFQMVPIMKKMRIKTPAMVAPTFLLTIQCDAFERPKSLTLEL